jgi:carbamoyl-phosphate synthase large subunit
MPRAGAVVAAAVVLFALLQHPARVLESHAVAALLAISAARHTHVVLGTYVQVVPSPHGPLIASVTQSCSALSSLLAIACLASVSRAGTRARRYMAISIALLVVVLGNTLRMAATLAVGEVAGRSVLVLFHDWVAGMFTFAYVLGGYILFLYLALPDRSAARAERVTI